MQLSWENWSALCELIGVGRIEDGKPQGCFVDEAGMSTQAQTPRLGVLTLTTGLAVEGDWFVRESPDLVVLVRAADWPAGYQAVPE
jgi:hypothetical protein